MTENGELAALLAAKSTVEALNDRYIFLFFVPKSAKLTQHAVWPNSFNKSP
jgi:hypothetical protein